MAYADQMRGIPGHKTASSREMPGEADADSCQVGNDMSLGTLKRRSEWIADSEAEPRGRRGHSVRSGRRPSRDGDTRLRRRSQIWRAARPRKQSRAAAKMAHIAEAGVR